MATGQMAIKATRKGAALLDKAIKLVRKSGKRDGEGNMAVKLTYGEFAREFGGIDGLRDTIDEVEARFDRIGFFIVPDGVLISLNV